MANPDRDIRWLVWFFFAMLIAFTNVSKAAKAGDEMADPGPAKTRSRSVGIDGVGAGLPETEKLMGKMLYAFAVVAVVCGGLWFVTRKMSVLRNRPGQPSRTLRLVDRIALAPRKSLCVVRVAGSLLVLGVAENGINLIMECPDDDARFDKALAAQDVEADTAAPAPSGART
ncbi:MAG TPA: flagellar biosynthetic protein FliO [Candidatus Brocadiia bacterium]|nr:flagellar biosynthetic protein FliO [Candidatus Brocadiia bacterium]